MNRLIKDGDIILDGTLPRYQKEKNAFLKLEKLEEYEAKIEMPLDKFLEWRLNSVIPYCLIEGKVKRVAHYNWLIERNIIEVWDANYRQRYRFHLRDYGKTWALTREELRDVSHN